MFAEYDDVVDLKQLQTMLGIGRNFAYALLKKGKIKSIKVGREYKIPKVNVIEYLESN